MKPVNDGFTPVINNSVAANIRMLQQNEAERKDLEQRLYQCRRKGRIPRNKRKEAADLQRRLDALTQKQDGVVPEVERQIEELRQGRRPFVAPDEEEQPFNECVGYAYGVAVCVDDSGTLLYCEAQEDAVEIGDTLPADELLPFADLPDGEQDMILRELLKDEGTPKWFREKLSAS